MSRIEDVVRRSHYVQKLAQLVGIDSKKLEASLLPAKGQPAKDKPVARVEAKRLFMVSSVEDYCLSLLLKHPELKEQCSELLPDYFEATENREIFNALIQVEDLDSIKNALDSAIWEHYEALTRRELPDGQMDIKLSEAILRLREDYLKRLAQRRSVIVSEDTPASQEERGAQPGEQDVAVSDQLREVFLEKERLGLRKRKQK